MSDPAPPASTTPTYWRIAEVFLLIGIVMLAIGRLDLLGEGLYAFPDEARYLKSWDAVGYAAAGQVDSVCYALSTTGGRPADAVLRLASVGLQYATTDAGQDLVVNAPAVQAINYGVFVLLLLVHYRFSRLVLGARGPALLSVLLYTALTSSYLYLRHVLPYDPSLLIGYYVVYKATQWVTERRLTDGRAVVLGLGGCLAYLTYPGYFPLPIAALGVVALGHAADADLLRNKRPVIAYGVGALAALFFFEVVAQVGGKSYFYSAAGLSLSISQGSYSESFTFLLKYLWQVEGLTGVLVGLGTAAAGVALVRDVLSGHRDKYGPVVVLAATLTGVYLAYAAAGFALHLFVLYGRLLHQYFPFLCTAAVAGLVYWVPRGRAAAGAAVAVAIAAVVNFVPNFSAYRALDYPRDIGRALAPAVTAEYVCEYDGILLSPSAPEVYKSADEFMPAGYAAAAPRVVVNACYLYPMDGTGAYRDFVAPAGYRQVYAAPHFINFVAYPFEGYDIAGRARIAEERPRVEVYYAE